MTFKLANWPAPKNISTLSTTRIPGFSLPPYDCNNLALHVDDDETLVKQNRQLLKEKLNLNFDPVWLEQTHSTLCVVPERENNRVADAATTRSWKHPLVILTADCLPITLCNIQGDEIAAIHAGWKGLLNGVVENTLETMKSSRNDLIAWIGPAICPNCFEVGEEVYASFTNKHPASQGAFKPNHSKWLANLPQIAELILLSLGVKAVYQSGLCTFELKNDFFSYRRTSQTGRIGTLIWFNNQPQE